MIKSHITRINFLIFLITIITCLLVYRKIATFLIIFLFLFCLINFHFFKNQSYRPFLKFILILNIPILLELLFFFNNESLKEGFKSLEKSLSCLILPYIIIALYKSISLKKILNYYSKSTILILIISLISFMFFEKEYFLKYLNGIHLWQMGYEFSNFIGIHAPALNMYLSFISIYFVYILINKVLTNNKNIVWDIILFIISFSFLLIINTRIALLTFLINFILLFITLKIERIKKTYIGISFLFVLIAITFIFINKFPYTIDKYTNQVFNNIDKIGRLDEVSEPEINIYSSLVTRISIWKSSYELGKKNILIGVGSSDAKQELVDYYKSTDQKFLYKYKFITHNQFLNYFLKYGIIGIFACFIYLLYPLYIYFKTKNIIILFFFINFFISNLTDDYLNKFDGLVYSAIWYSIFTCYFIKHKTIKND